MIRNTFKIAFVFALVLTAGVVAADWTAPVNPTPPTCAPGNPGCDAPINVSANRQTKKGPLELRWTPTPADKNILWISDSTTADAPGTSGVEIGKYGQSKFYNFFVAGNALQAVTNGADSLAFYAGGNGARSYGIKSIGGFVGSFHRGKIGLVASNRNGHWGVTASSSLVDTNPGALITLIDNGSYSAYFDGPIKINGGSPGINKVLISTDTTGTAAWVATSSLFGPTGPTGGVSRIDQGAGILLSPNPITGVGSVAADTNYVQRRVSASCAVGSAIRSIAADGTVTCQSAAASTYGAVPPLSPTDTSEPCSTGSICSVTQTTYRPAGLDSRIIMLKTKTSGGDTGIYEVFCPAGYVMIGVSYDGTDDDHVQNIYCSPLIAQ